MKTALGQKEDDIINSYLLLDFRHQKLIGAREGKFSDSIYESLRAFFKDFDSQWYLSAMRSPEILLDIQRQEQITVDTFRLMKIIGNAGHDYWIIKDGIDVKRHLYDILDFIEQKISRGLIETISTANGKDLDILNFNDRFNIFEIETKIEDENRQAKQYHAYIKAKNQNDWSKSSLYKSKFDAYLKQLTGLHGQLKIESSRLFIKLGRERYNDHVSFKIKGIEEKVDLYLDDLQKIYESFAKSENQ